MTVLKGPADADHFRVKVGRYGDRWYTDPLTGCTIAPPSDWQGPSVTQTKPPFANKYVPMRSIADMPSEDWTGLAGKPADDRYEAIKSHDKLTSRTNMDRGSIVHLWAEDLLFGRPVERKLIKGSKAAIEQAERFLPALESFFDTHQPELVACEVVCLHRTLNGVGYGGTLDALTTIEGDKWVIDWKSRNSDHAAYPDDAGQGGAYIGAEYMIVQGPDGNPMRTELPKVAGVLIVSIREDGFRAYPIDADGAISHYEAMHAWWCAQQDLTRNKVIGRPWAPKVAAPVGSPDGERPSTGEPVTFPGGQEQGEDRCPTSTPTTSYGSTPTPTNSSSSTTTETASPTTTLDISPPSKSSCAPGSRPSSTTPSSTGTASESSRRAEAIRRYDLLNDEQKADYTARKQAIDTNDLDAVERLLDEVEPFNRVIEPPLTDAEWYPFARAIGIPPDEGPDVDAETIAALQREFERLSDEAKFWIASLTAQGRKAGVDWRPNALPTVRRYELARGIVRLAQSEIHEILRYPGAMDELLGEVIRGLLGAATGREEVEQEALPLGAAIGTLDAAEATRFAQLVDDYVSTGSAA